MQITDLSQTCCIKKDNLFFLRTHKTIPLSDIIMLQANVNYTVFHLKSGKQFMSARSIKLYDLTLGGHGFIRTHRAYLINRQHLREYDNLNELILMSNNLTALISRRKKGNLIPSF
jgi:two-component system, LytTR family, response regulator